MCAAVDDDSVAGYELTRPNEQDIVRRDVVDRYVLDYLLVAHTVSLVVPQA